MKFINKENNSRYGRYRIIPEAGNDFVKDTAVASKAPNYLFEEIEQRISKGPSRFHILVQLANEGDTVNDATIHWPEDRTQLELGTISLDAVAPHNAEEQQHIIFDPIPRVDGIEPSDDPLLELRAAIYLLSGRRRRAVGAEEKPAQAIAS
jgi:catalase